MVNKAILLGYLGNNPEIRTTASGQQICSFRLATNRRWMKDGKEQKFTEWHNIVIFGSQASNCYKYLKKGSKVFVEGRIETKKWQDKDGNDRYTTEIIAADVRFLDSKGSSEDSGDIPF